MEVVVFLVVLVPSLVVMGVILGVKQASLMRARRRMVDEGDVDVWFRRAGLERVPTPQGEVGARASSRDGSLTVALDVDSFADFGLNSVVTFTLDLSDVAPAGVTMGPLDWWDHDGVKKSGNLALDASLARDVAGTFYRYEGDERDVWAWMGSGLPERLLEVYLVCGLNNVKSRSKGGVVSVEVSSALGSIGGPDLFERVVGALMSVRERMERREDRMANLVSVLTRHGNAFAPHGSELAFSALVWEVAQVLCTEHADHEEVRALDDRLDEQGVLTRAACLRWGVERGVFRRPAEVCVEALRPAAQDAHVGANVCAVLTREFAWHTLVDPRMPTFTRMDAAPRAFTSSDAPTSARAKDEALVEVFTSKECAKSLALAIVFDQLTAAGWRPGAEAARRIATDGDRAGREKILEFIQGRPNKLEYAGALAALKDAKVSGAARFFDDLDLSEVGGKLSLASDDTSRGGLTQAGERGGLSATED